MLLFCSVVPTVVYLCSSSASMTHTFSTFWCFVADVANEWGTFWWVLSSFIAMRSDGWKRHITCCFRMALMMMMLTHQQCNCIFWYTVYEAKCVAVDVLSENGRWLHNGILKFGKLLFTTAIIERKTNRMQDSIYTYGRQDKVKQAQNRELEYRETFVKERWYSKHHKSFVIHDFLNASHVKTIENRIFKCSVCLRRGDALCNVDS